MPRCVAQSTWRLLSALLRTRVSRGGFRTQCALRYVSSAAAAAAGVEVENWSTATRRRRKLLCLELSERAENNHRRSFFLFFVVLTLRVFWELGVKWRVTRRGGALRVTRNSSALRTVAARAVRLAALRCAEHIALLRALLCTASRTRGSPHSARGVMLALQQQQQRCAELELEQNSDATSAQAAEASLLEQAERRCWAGLSCECGPAPIKMRRGHRLPLAYI